MSPRPAPALFSTLSKLTRYLSQDCLGGPRPLKLSWVINLQKGGTLVFVAGLMWWLEHSSTAAWVYLALHGSYGLCWLLKELAFPDEGWQVKVTLMGALNACMMVGFVANAALRGIRLAKVEIETAGELDLRGFLGLDASVAAGYEGVKTTVRIAGDATPEQFAELHEAVRATSPNFFNFTRPVPVEMELVVE